MAAGLRRTPIHALTHGSKDFFLVAIIIAKQSPRVIQSKNVNSTRCVWNFTLRDSPAHYINVSFWGASEFIENLARNFHIGDVVDVIRAKAALQRNEDGNFMPYVTSPLLLTMNEGISEMCLHEEHDCAEFHQLLRLPTRPPSDYLTLSDIHSNGQALRGKHANLLVAVKTVGVLRQVTTKMEGKQLDSREVEVMDQSPTSLYIQLWGAETAYLPDNWKPRETILFMADVKLDWSDYKKCITGTVNSRTIITENPNIADAAELREHARTAPTVRSVILDQLATNFPDPATITSVMSCQTVWNTAVNGQSAQSFTALVLAAIVDLDLDGMANYTVTKCLLCQMMVEDSVGLCMNADCPVSSGMERPQCQRVFDIHITLADHTGALRACRVTSAAASQVLNCSPEEFDCMSENLKTELKWQFLLKKCASRLVVLPASGDRTSPLISVLALEKVSLSEYAAKLPMY